MIDLGWELLPDQKIKNGINKVLSRKALRGICAKEILDRIDASAHKEFIYGKIGIDEVTEEENGE